MLIVLQDINTTPKELKTERDRSYRQLLAQLSVVVSPYRRAPKRAKQLSMATIPL